MARGESHKQALVRAFRGEGVRGDVTGKPTMPGDLKAMVYCTVVVGRTSLRAKWTVEQVDRALKRRDQTFLSLWTTVWLYDRRINCDCRASFLILCALL